MEQKRTKVTRKDIAREAGVSETIVSYVMNNNRYVDKEKKKRVLEAVNKLGYRPNSIARALKGKKLNHHKRTSKAHSLEKYKFLRLWRRIQVILTQKRMPLKFKQRRRK